MDDQYECLFWLSCLREPVRHADADAHKYPDAHEHAYADCDSNTPRNFYPAAH
jgi:hypothetical protein